MSLDRGLLRRAVDAHGAVARVVVAAAAGSAPREPGAAMLVWAGGQSGTIGGGALEYAAADRARARLAAGAAPALFARIPLGPGLGQCCGGAVTLVTELYDSHALERLGDAPGGVHARPVAPGADATPPLALRRVLNRARSAGVLPAPQLVEGWLVEPLTTPARPLWIWGAGHVGRALVATLAPLPGFAITWIDTAEDRFPPEIPAGVTRLVAAHPAGLVAHAPAAAAHLVLTYSHALDLELCHRLLGHGFASAGLIGSASKWARFRSRLRQLGHPDARIDRIACPIGDPALGKHPQAIAVGVAAGLLRQESAEDRAREAMS